jgi:hypothetical protein
MAKKVEQAENSTTNLIITCYGQFWDRALVNWRGVQGRQREHPKLGGKLGSKLVDMADQIGIYVLYDERYEPVYAGQVGRPKSKNHSAGVGGNTLFARLKAHADGEIGGRWRFFSWYGLKRINKDGRLRAVTVRQVKVKTIIDALEAAMVASFEPRLNSQSGNLKSAKLVKQEPDPETLSNTLETRLDRIEQGLKNFHSSKK